MVSFVRIAIGQDGVQALLQGWKGSAKARNLVLAVHNFYTDQLHHLANKPNPDSKAPGQKIEVVENGEVSKAKEASHTLLQEKIVATTVEDAWTIKYINTFQLRPLLEALDPDYSGFVTVNELNEFTVEKIGQARN